MSGEECFIAPEEEEEFLALWVWYRTHWVEFIEQVLQVQLEPNQKELVNLVQDNERVESTCAHGAGKSLSLDTLLPTPAGWTTIGDVKVGDSLYDEQGQVCQVEYVAPIENRDCYEIEFDDHTKVVCSGEHDWNAFSDSRKHKVKWEIRPSKLCRKWAAVNDWRDFGEYAETVNTAHMYATQKVYGQYNWAVPCARAIVGNSNNEELILAPYVLGAWLGDGTSASANICIGNADYADMEASFRANNLVLNKLPSGKTGNAWSYSIWHKNYSSTIMKTLRAIGVLGCKHIPMKYLRANEQARLELLKGLMDTDGFARQGGGLVGIQLSSKQLADDVAELIRSFGWKAYRTVIKYKLDNGVSVDSYCTEFRPDRPVFRLTRKINTWKEWCGKTHQSMHTARTIHSIRPVPTVPTRCISVNSPSHLFLCTESFVPSHNTFTSACILLTVMSLWPFATCVSTAPTFRQVEKLLWAEVGRRFASSLLPDLGFTPPNTTNWKIAPGWFATGESSDNPEKIEGFHSPTAMLYLVDEAKAVPDGVFNSIEGGMNSPFTRQLRITTPGPSRGEAWKCSRGETRHLWKHKTISAWDVPRLRKWAQERKDEWGENSPIYKMRVLGQYVDGFQNELFSEELISKMIDNYANGTVIRSGIKVVSADLATKQDRTVFTYRTGNYIDSQEKVEGLRLDEIANLLFKRTVDFKADVVVVDALNLGIGVHDILVSKGLGDKIIPFISQARPEEDIYFNRKAELAFKVKKGILDGAIGGMVHEELKIDLLGYDYEVVAKGQKEVYRLYDPNVSPDFGDSLLMAFAPDFNITACVGVAPKEESKESIPLQPGAEREILAKELADGRIPEKIKQKYGFNTFAFRRGRHKFTRF